MSLQIHIKRTNSKSFLLFRRTERHHPSGSEHQHEVFERVHSHITSKSTIPRSPSNDSIHSEMDTTPRRSTVTSIIPHQRAATPRYGQAQCTHLTVTRLYTKEFRCSVCFREGPAGWLWRCIQDRELLLEEDMERGFEVCCEIGHMQYFLLIGLRRNWIIFVIFSQDQPVQEREAQLHDCRS
jgi:hypothetical protein